MAEFLAGAWSISVDEIRRRHALLSFHLHFEQLQRVQGRNPRSAATLDQNLCAASTHVQPVRSPNVEILPAKAGVSTGPRLEAAQAIQDFLRGQMEINPAIFFLEDGRQGRSA